MNTRLRLTLVAGTALAAIAALAVAATAPSTTPSMGDRPRFEHGPPSLAGIIRHHAEELKIDEATVSQIASIEQDARTRVEPLEQSLKAGHESMRALMESDDVDESQVVAQVQSLGATQTALQVERVKTDIAVRKLLSTEQLQALRDLKPRHEGFGKGGGCRGGRMGARTQSGPDGQQGMRGRGMSRDRSPAPTGT